MDVSIIIVSYNTADLTLACLASLQTPDDLEKEIFVVDNASQDNSVARIRERFPQVTVIDNAQNRGFGQANNQALPHCRGRYIIFLNPDTAIAKNTLQKAFLYMDKNPSTGLAGAKILNPDGSLQPSVSYRYPGEKFAGSELQGLAGSIACVMGAFMIARRELIDELGGFDEDFFLYGEDQDLAWRIREKGFSIGYIEDAIVFHWGGQSEVQTPPVALFEKKLKAEYLFYTKHYSPHTIARIKRSQRQKAKFRMITLQLTSFFARDKFNHENKAKCYRIALNMAQD
jgi:GT2 family glycosyltransferase